MLRDLEVRLDRKLILPNGSGLMYRACQVSCGSGTDEVIYEKGLKRVANDCEISGALRIQDE